MNFTFINKIYLLIFLNFFFISCNSNTIIEKIKIEKNEVPKIENQDNSDINLNSYENKKINFDIKLVLDKFKNDNPFFDNVIIKNNKIYSLNSGSLYNFDINTGEIISSKEILSFEKGNDQVISFQSFKNSFICVFKSGNVMRLDLDANILWHNKYNQLINTKFLIYNNQIILFFIDKVMSISAIDGNEIWTETYDNPPIYQSKGGQFARFFDLIFFILPNNRTGAIDLNFGTVHNSKFNDLKLISSINNSLDKIFVYENNLIYVDEGKYINTIDLFDDDVILKRKNINSYSSSFLFKNSIILKKDKYIEAINLINGKTFWLIANEKIDKNSKIITVRNINKNIEIFLDNGDVLEINKKKLVNVSNLGVGKINNISFDKLNIIVYTKKNKIIIF